MIYLKSVAIGAIIGAAITGVSTYFITKEKFEKEFEEWQHDYIKYRTGLAHRCESRKKGETSEAKTEEPAVEESIDDPKTISETVKAWEKMDQQEYESAVDSYSGEAVENPDGNDEEEEEDEENSVHGDLELSDEDMHDCLRLIEVEGYDIEDVADRYDISKQALQLLLDDYKERCRTKREHPKFPAPYVITEEAYETEMLHHEKCDLILYRGDNVIIDADTTEQIIEVGRLLGKPSNLYRNKENSEHYIFIRNDDERIDYRIFCDLGNSEGE